MKNKFTIYIPTFNRKNKLYKLVKYLLNYNFINIHIFDNSINSLKYDPKFLKLFKHSNLKYNKNKSNLGLVGNFNKILKNINSEYFMILADDDFVNVTFIENSLKEFINNNELAWVGSKSLIYNIVDKEYYFVGYQLKNKNYHFDIDSNQYEYNVNYNLPLCSIIFNYKFLNNKVKINKIGDDRSLLFKISLNNKYKIINSIGGIFTINESSFTYNGGYSNFNKDFIKTSKNEEIKEIINYTHIKKKSKLFAINKINFFYDSLKLHKDFSKNNFLKKYFNLIYNFKSLNLANIILSNYRKNILD